MKNHTNSTDLVETDEIYRKLINKESQLRQREQYEIVALLGRAIKNHKRLE